MHQIRVFISHSWAYSEHYETLAQWVFQERWELNETPITFEDVSVPKSDPIHNTENQAQLKQAIYSKISLANVVVIPTGMYTNYSTWIQKEINGANSYLKPILAVNPWAQERKSSIVAAASREQVGWNKKSVIDGIWKLK